MLRTKIIYISLIAVTAAVSAFFDVKSAGIVLGFEIALIPMLLIYVFAVRRNIEAEIKIPYFHTRKENDFNIDVRLVNKSILPVTDLWVRIGLKDIFTDETASMKEEAVIDSKGEAVLRFTVKARYSGKVRVELEQLRVFDPLHLFSIRLKKDTGTDEFLVLPRFQKIFIGGNASSKLRHEWEQCSHTASGEDISEVFDVHEYRNGDKLSRVHWKLTAKTGDYLVKEYSLPVENMIFFFADLRIRSGEAAKRDRSELDGYFELLASISWSLAWEGISHVVIWYDAAKKATMIEHIEHEKDVYGMIEKIFGSPLYDVDYDLKTMYMTEHEREIKADNSLLINTDGDVFFGDVCIDHFDLKDAERKLMEWKLEI